jgi:hypothetical protein
MLETRKKVIGVIKAKRNSLSAPSPNYLNYPNYPYFKKAIQIAQKSVNTQTISLSFLALPATY